MSTLAKAFSVFNDAKMNVVPRLISPVNVKAAYKKYYKAYSNKKKKPTKKKKYFSCWFGAQPFCFLRKTFSDDQAGKKKWGSPNNS